MIALISPAKTMLDVANANSKGAITEPRFIAQTNHIVSSMLHYSASELSEIFKISAPLAQQLRARFISMVEDDGVGQPAVESYNGVVYKHFKGEFTKADATYLQKRVRISSLLYGLLRPYDAIKPYRMEGFVRLSDSDQRVDKYWRDIHTQTLIEDVNAAGGILLYLASKEEQNCFNWREVLSRVRVVDIEFLQRKGDKLRQVVVYTKMARGEMIRYMLDNKIDNADHLKRFEWEGYLYCEELSSADKWVWING